MNIVDDVKARVFRQSAIPDRTGPHAVGTARLKLHISGEDRQERPLLVQLWYPADGTQTSVRVRILSWLAKLLHPTWAPAHHGAPLATPKSPFPLIVYVPEAHGHHDDNTFTLSNLASHGFVLAAVDAPYRNGKADVRTNSADGLQGSNGISDPAAAHYADRVARGVATASALLDALQALDPNVPGGVWTECVDLRQVGILGHAMGGAVAAETALADPRYRVAANLDGTMCGKARVVGVPYLMMLSDFSIPAPRSTPRTIENAPDVPSRVGDYRRAQRQAALPESHVIEVAGTLREHFSDRLTFASRLFTSYQQLPNSKRVRAIIDSYMVAFFTTYLRREPHPLMCVRHSPYPEVCFVTGADENADWLLREPAGRG